MKSAGILGEFMVIVLYIFVCGTSALSNPLKIPSHFFTAGFRFLRDPMARIPETKGKNETRTDNKWQLERETNRRPSFVIVSLTILIYK